MSERRPVLPGADERIRAWLDDVAPVDAPRDFVDATMAPIPAMAQRRRSITAIGRMQVPVATMARYGAIAAVLIVLVVASIVALRPPPGPGSTPGPSASPSQTITASVPLPSGVSYTNDGPLGVGSGPQAPLAGTYQTRFLRPALRFTVPAGWTVTSITRTFVSGSEEATGLPLSNGGKGIVITTPTSVDPPAPGDLGSPIPADLFAWLLANPNLELGPASDVTIGGVAGRSAEGTLSASADIDPEEGAYRVVDFLPLLPRQHFRLAVIVVDGQQLIVATVADATAFDAFVPIADGVIDTFEFPDR